MKPIDKEILLLKIDSKIEEAQKVFNVAPSSVIGGMIEGYTRTKKIISSLEVKEVDLEEEPVSDDLEEACEQLAENARKHKAETSSPFFSQTDYKQGVIDGAKWKEEQFEKNRLAACDKQTEEEAEIEQSFLMGIIECEHRQPTFDDAIKYGMRLQKEQMMKDATEATVHIEAGNYPYIPQMELYDYDKDIPLAKEGDKYKVILIKEDLICR